MGQSFELMQFVMVKKSGKLGRVYAINNITGEIMVTFRDDSDWFEPYELVLHTMQMGDVGTHTPFEIKFGEDYGVSAAVIFPPISHSSPSIGEAIQFQRDGHTVGTLSLVIGKVTFKGDIDETVKVFAEILRTLPMG